MDNMNITNAQYIADADNNNISIKFTIDGKSMSVGIPSVGNRHYDEIMRQVADGDLTIADAD